MQLIDNFLFVLVFPVENQNKRNIIVKKDSNMNCKTNKELTSNIV